MQVSLCFAQTYHFDYALQYDHEISKNIISLQQVINSTDGLYILQIQAGKTKQSAVLVDYKNSEQHFFKMISGKFPLKTDHFQYQFSKKLLSLDEQFKKEDERRFFQTELVENKDRIRTYKLTEYHDVAKKKSRAMGVLKMAEFDDQLSSFGLSNLLDYVNAGKKIKFEENLILIEGEMQVNGGTIRSN